MQKTVVLGDPLVPEELHVTGFTIFTHTFMLYNH